MPSRASFSIAGFAFTLEAEDARALEPVAADWAPFRSAAPSSTTLHLDVGPPRPTSATTALPFAEARADGSLWLSGDGFSAQLSADRKAGRIAQPLDRAPTEAVVRVLLAESLARRGGMLLHGVAVASRGKAAVFTGPSGAGKSTLGSFAAGADLQLLADELVALVPGPHGFVVHGTPWNVGTNNSAVLAQLGLLAHAAAPALSPLPPSAVLRVLLSNVLEPYDVPAARAQSFQSASRVLAAATTSQLAFAPDAGVARVLIEALR